MAAPPIAFIEFSSAAWGFIGVVVGAALSIVKGPLEADSAMIVVTSGTKKEVGCGPDP